MLTEKLCYTQLSSNQSESQAMFFHLCEKWYIQSKATAVHATCSGHGQCCGVYIIFFNLLYADLQFVNLSMFLFTTSI